MWAVVGAVWAVAASVWTVAVFMWAVSDPVWAITAYAHDAWEPCGMFILHTGYRIHCACYSGAI